MTNGPTEKSTWRSSRSRHKSIEGLGATGGAISHLTMFPSILLYLLTLSLVASYPTDVLANSETDWTDNVDLDYSLVRGIKQGGLKYYTGIRYASKSR